MSVPLLPWPRAKFFAPNTNYPLAGGKVYTYVAGTNTPLATFTSPSGLVANANPVILDANGEAAIYLGTGLSYKINVTDASDIQVPGFPVDNVIGAEISGVADALRADLASSDPTLGSSLVTYFKAIAGWVSRTVSAKLFDYVTVADFGASPDASGAVNTAKIQAAIDYMAVRPTGGAVRLLAGAYNIDKAGVLATRDYGLILKSNVHLVGEGIGITILRAVAGTDMDVITTPRTTPFVNVGLFGLTVDGNKAAAAGGKMNIWICNGDGFYFDQLGSINSGEWAVRLDLTTNTIGGSYRNNTPAAFDANGDGFHIKDSSYIAIDKIIINQPSDDGLIIEATTADCHDIVIGEVVISTTLTNLAGGRGIFLFCDDTVAVSNKSIFNVQINNASTINCKGSALVVETANFFNVNINLVDFGSGGGVASAYIAAGSALFTGEIHSCSFDIKSFDPNGSGLSAGIFGASKIKHNSLSLSVYNPKDGTPGCTLYGEFWTGDISIDYDPSGTKVSPVPALDLYATKSILTADTVGGSNCINLRPAASDNTINLGQLNDSTGVVLNINATANANIFMGGSVPSLADAGSGNTFTGTRTLDRYGRTAGLTPDGSGLVLIPHGLVTTPRSLQTSLLGSTLYTATPVSADGTNITVLIKSGTAPITVGSFTVDWSARV